MDELATNLLASLKRSSVAAEAKVAQFNTLKSHIKHQRVPESAQSAIVECVRLAITAQTSTTLVQAGFSALGHLVKRLTIQDQVGPLYAPRQNLLHALLDRLGDPKEGYRAAASQSLCDLWPARQIEVEKVVREGAIQGSNARAKEAGMQWVVKMHTEQGLQFRNFVPPMIECLEDADGQVREAAKTSIIELFSTARDAAKADLKRQLVAFNVRRSIASHILSTLQVPSDFGASVAHPHPHLPAARSDSPAQDAHLSQSIASESRLPSSELEELEPLYVSSQRELEDMFRQMHPAFEDKETEDNWRVRESNVLKMRRLLRGNVPTEYQAALLAGVKNLLDGILKVVNTLRTTMSTTGCQLVQDLANVLGSALDPMVEILLKGLEKMSASTKHISAQNADRTVDTILARVSFHSRLMQHIWLAAQDKNVQPRQFAAGWLKTILRRQISNKSQFEHLGGLDVAEKVIKKGLADANPKVRENMRSAYWMFAQAWPEKGEAIMGTLDPKSKQLLEKDPANPNAGSTNAAFTVSVGPSATSNPRAAGGRPSLKEAIAAQRKASNDKAKRAPERPTSAMSSFSPVREAPSSAPRPASSAINAPRGRPPPPMAPSVNIPQRPNISSSVSLSGQGTLSSAPMRRPRRPDVPRPATADLYANRRTLKADTPPRSPAASPPRPLRSSNLGGPHARPESAASVRGSNASGHNSRTNSPQVSPVRSRPRAAAAEAAASIRGDGPLSPLAASSEDNLTMVFPLAANAARFSVQPVSGQQSIAQVFGEPTVSISAEDDNFTLIIPTKPSDHPSLPPPNSQVDILPTIEDEPTKTMTMPIMQSVMMAQEPSIIIEALPQSNAGAPMSSMLASPLSEDQLIVFEDTSPKDDVIPDAIERSSSRAALEELQPSDQNMQPNLIDERSEDKSSTTSTPHRPRSTSPSKKNQQVIASETLHDRTEVLKTRRLFASGIERIKSRTLDIHGFRKVQELVKANAQSDYLRFDELYAALLDFVKAADDDLKVNSVKAQSLKSQALAMIRLLHSLGVNRGKAPEAVCALLAASKHCGKTSHLGLDLERTSDIILAQAEDVTEPCMDAVLLLADDYVVSSQSVLVGSLNTLAKLLKSLRSRGVRQLDTPTMQRFGKLARRCFNDLDADVRQADTQMCLELSATMGKDNEELFWKTLGSISEAQLNLLAYYMARRGVAARGQ